MKEINIASTLVLKRKEKGITQDELASYMGVSKLLFQSGKRAGAIRILLYFRSLHHISILVLMN